MLSRRNDDRAGLGIEAAAFGRGEIQQFGRYDV